MRTIAILLCLIVVASAHSFTQNPPAPSQGDAPTQPIREAAALQIIRTALSSLGGGSAIPSDWIIQGASQSTGTTRPPTTFVWKGSGEEFRVELQGPSYSRVFVSGHGAPVVRENDKTSGVPYHVARAHRPFYLPAIVLWAEINDPNLTVRAGTPTPVSGVAALHVRISDESDEVGSWVTPQDWYFDPATSLPLRVKYRIPSPRNAKDFDEVTVDFGDFRPTAAMMLPYRLVYSVEGHSLTATISSATFNTGLPAPEFDLSAGGAQ